MKSCEECQSLIDLYIDDELTREQKQRFMSHISSCSECRKALDFAENVKATLANLPELEIPDDFNLKLKNKLKNESVKKKGFGTYGVRYGSLAACLVLAIAIAQGVEAPDFTKSNDSKTGYNLTEKATENDLFQADMQDAGDNIPTPTNDKGAAEPAPQSKIKSRQKAADPIPTKAPAEQGDVTVSEAVLAEPVEDTQKEFSADYGISTASLADETVSDNTPMVAQAIDEEAPAMRNNQRAMPSEPLTIAVDVTMFDIARTIAAEYATSADGIFTADIEKFNTILEKLAEQEVIFTKVGDADGEIVEFVLKVQ